MNTDFQQNLQRHFQELYVRKNMGKGLIAQDEKQAMEISQGNALLQMKIDEGLKFITV